MFGLEISKKGKSTKMWFNTADERDEWLENNYDSKADYWLSTPSGIWVNACDAY